MTIRETWKTALVASVVVALSVAVIEYFVFSGGTIYVAQVEWDQVEAMPYGEAKEYLAERVGHVSNLESVLNGTAYKEFWLRFIYEVFIYFLLAFASCLLFVRLSQSNQSLKSGTPQSGAP